MKFSIDINKIQLIDVAVQFNHFLTEFLAVLSERGIEEKWIKYMKKTFHQKEYTDGNKHTRCSISLTIRKLQTNTKICAITHLSKSIK